MISGILNNDIPVWINVVKERNNKGNINILNKYCKR